MAIITVLYKDKVILKYETNSPLPRTGEFVDLRELTSDPKDIRKVNWIMHQFQKDGSIIVLLRVGDQVTVPLPAKG